MLQGSGQVRTSRAACHFSRSWHERPTGCHRFRETEQHYSSQCRAIRSFAVEVVLYLHMNSPSPNRTAARVRLDVNAGFRMCLCSPRTR